MAEIRREDFDDIARLAMAEGDTYPVPRLLDRENVNLILHRITV